jgi:hypothetical protein
MDRSRRDIKSSASSQKVSLLQSRVNAADQSQCGVRSFVSSQKGVDVVERSRRGGPESTRCKVIGVEPEYVEPEYVEPEYDEPESL